MALELVYTSAARGLRAGTSGFCTVAMTKGMPPALVPRLEALGGYRPGPNGDGPEAFCFWRVETATGIAHVLSVVGPAPPDHTARTNKIATYLVLSPEELAPAGPAAMIARAGLLRRSWTGAPAWIEEPVRVPLDGDASLRACAAWQRACGDAGWAGVLASAFLRDQSKPIHVIYRAGTDPLPLVDEAMRLLPDWVRWRATFSTYFLQPVAGTPCAWRFCLEGTAAADAARQSKGLVIDLTRPLDAAPESRFVRMARTGVDEEAAAQRAKSISAAPRGKGAAPAAPAGIELEPDLDPLPSAPAPGRPLRTPAPRSSVEVTIEPEPAVKPTVVALVAAALTIVILGVIAIVVLKAGNGAAPAPAPRPEVPVVPAIETPVPEPAPEQQVAPPVEPPVEPARTPEPEPAPAPEPAPEQPPAQEPPPEAVSTATPPPPAAPESEPAPNPSKAIPSTAEALMPPSVFVSLEPSASAGIALRGRSQRLPAGIKSARLVPGHALRIAGIDAGDRGGIEFAGPAIRASVAVEAGQLTVVGYASGTAPAPLLAALGIAEASTPSATEVLQRSLERCSADLLDASGSVVARAQFRQRRTDRLEVDSPRRVTLTGIGDGPIDVALLGPGNFLVAASEVANFKSTTVRAESVADILVNRETQVDAALIAATRITDGNAERVGEVTQQLFEASRLKRACEVLKLVSNGGRRGPDFEAEASMVLGAMTEPERAQLRISGESVTVTDPVVLGKMSEAVLPRAVERVDALSAVLRKLKATSGKAAPPPKWRLRVTDEDGLVLLESDIVPAPGARP